MTIPFIQKRNGHSLLMVHDRPFVLLSGEVHNSSSSSTEYMDPIWKKCKTLNLNSVLLPISWEMVEPEEGKWEFGLVDGLLNQARANDMKIGFLWFGSWKNAQCSYAPPWVKEDRRRFLRAEVQKGQKLTKTKLFFDMPFTTLSAFCPATMKADARAFQKLMEHLREVDGDQNTVIMVQVENETGILGSARDHSDVADLMFSKKVPKGLINYLNNHQTTLETDIRDELQKGITDGSWEEVFGEVSQELFTAYHTAKFVHFVAKAGKDAYPLPMAVNAWLAQGGQPGQYPSGGPIARVMEVWKYAAPEIDVFCPDIYVPAFCKVCEEYTKANNPLFIPEIAGHAYAGIREIYAIGHHHAMGYSPFGIEDLGGPVGGVFGSLFGMDVSDPALKQPQNIEIYAKINDLLRQMLPLLTSKYGTKDLQAVIQEQKNDSCMVFGKYGIKAVFDLPFFPVKEGVCLALKCSDNEFLILASGCLLSPYSLDENRPFLDILSLEEGSLNHGNWVMRRKWNGDEQQMLMIGEPLILKMKLSAYR